MEYGQRLNKKAETILNKKGYSIKISFYKSENRNEDCPDYVQCSLFKNNQLMFQSEFRTCFEGNVYDEFGSSIIAECFDIQKNEDFKRQAEMFAEVEHELSKLKSGLRLFCGKKIERLSLEAEKLRIFRQSFIPFSRDGFYADIKLIKSGQEELIAILEALKKLKTEQREDSKRSAPKEMGAE